MSPMDPAGPDAAPEQRIEELTRRVAELERRLGALEQAPTAAAPAPTPWPPPPVPPAAPYPGQQPPAPIPPPPAPGPPRRFPGPARAPAAAHRAPIDSETFLKWAGLGLVVLAALFLVGTAISRGWIGPELQLLGATLVGVGLLAGAFRLAPTSRSWSEALAAGGALVLPTCAAAANAALDLWPNGPALAVLAMVTVALGIVARLLSQQAVLAIAAAAAAILPFWIGEDPPLDALVVAGWLAVLTVSAVAVALVFAWTGARLISTAVSTLTIWVLAIDTAGDLDDTETAIGTVLLAVVSLVAWAAPAVAERSRRGPTGWLRALDHRFVLYLPIWAWASAVLVLDVDTDRAVGQTALVIVGLFTAALLAAWPFVERRLVLSHLLGAGVLLTVALSFVLTDGAVLLIAVAAQAAATAVLAWRFGDRLLQIQALLLSGATWLWAAGAMVVGLFTSLSGAQHLADAVVVALLIAAVPAAVRVVAPPMARTAASSLAVIAWIGWLLWVGSVFSQATQGQVVISAVWAASAAVSLIFGVRAGEPLARGLGLATLVVVLVKLLTIDLAAIDTLWRVGLFFVIGAGLLRLGYVLPSLTPDADPPDGPAGSSGGPAAEPHRPSPLA